SNRNKTLFLSRVSHELRTPLNGILGFAQLIQRDAANDAKQRQRADLILQSGWHMLDLVEEILDLSAAELGQLRVKHMEVDLGEAMRHSLPRFIALAHEARVELIDRVPDDGSLRVFGDSTRMQQVINNLLSNAIKYNRPLGRVTVSAERMGGSIALTVEDTGIGMSEDQVSRLFMPFERLGAERTSVKGTGVGLALTKWLIELMGGSLVVHSRPGAGSTFTATFSAVSA
ncbi:MAG TPA: HAMP domain-containing sensor histidine kinase, partial [Albitalea sp.]|nr:HAMP domain-containing sensor histidine kinase [Albitalea sp.]